MASVTRLQLAGFAPIKGDKARRYRNEKTGEIISLRQFQKRASRVQVEVKPKPRLTAREKRIRWMANHINREVWESGGAQWEYQSYREIENSFEFQYYESLVHSGYESDRELAREFWDELEEEYAEMDWGESP